MIKYLTMEHARSLDCSLLWVHLRLIRNHKLTNKFTNNLNSVPPSNAARAGIVVSERSSYVNYS